MLEIRNSDLIQLAVIAQRVILKLVSTQHTQMAHKLNLGSGTGSLINHIMSAGTPHEPVVGMGATILMWTDRHAATIVEVSKKRIGVVEDEAIRTDKNYMSESQSYEYRKGSGEPIYFTLRKNGAWVQEGYPMKNGTRIAIGYRDHYYDYSF
jgi:hypothetical protein